MRTSIPHVFRREALAEAEAARPAGLAAAARTGARSPLVTIDPADAKDHDDAVFAEPDTDPNNPGGFIVNVAIADVAHYVHAGLGARPRGAGARQLGLFPRPRRADAARAHLERSVLAAPERGPRGARRAHGDRRRRPQAQPHVPSRADALGREAALRAGAGRRRRPHRRRPPAPLLATGDRAALRGLRGASSASATSASRSISTCPSARSCSRPTARSIA